MLVGGLAEAARLSQPGTLFVWTVLRGSATLRPAMTPLIATQPNPARFKAPIPFRLVHGGQAC